MRDVRVHSFTGAIEYSYPLSLSPARDLTPELTLAYHLNSSHSLFGFGFDLLFLKIERATTQGIPLYDDEKDLFVMVGVGELVLLSFETRDDGWKIIRFQPRVENNFQRIELWRKEKEAADNYWIIREGNGVNHILGKSATTKVTDPVDETRISTWVIEQSYDAKGNKILYRYDQGKTNEDQEISANVYLRSIHYGNYVYQRQNDTQPREYFAFEVVFDYGEYSIEENISKIENEHEHPSLPYKKSDDILTSFRSGFARKIDRLCHNIFLFHHFEHLFEGRPFLVKRWTFNYQSNPPTLISLLDSIQEFGYRKLQTGEYLSKAIPPIRFTYSPLQFNNSFAGQLLQFTDETVTPHHQTPYEFIDFYHEGRPGILYNDNETVLYWRNLGEKGFAAPETLGTWPREGETNTVRHRLMDIPGTEQLALVVGEQNYGGFYENRENGDWKNFQLFESYPRDFINFNAEFIDINGGGVNDLAVFNQAEPVFYPAQGKKGFGAAVPIICPEDFPMANSIDPSQLVTFANILGDGLMHRVHITSNQISYWPNLGHGRFGEKIKIENTPDFGDEFNAAQLYLANVKGMGGVDLIYIHAHQIEIYLNKNGQGFAKHPITITLPEQYSHFDRLHFVDLLGKGVPCLVFTPMGSVKHYYYDFAPHGRSGLLKKIDNSCGASTEITYTSAPFAPIVVQKMVTADQLSGLSQTQCYQFHKGHYDIDEREFAGFGFVEHWDTEIPVKEAEKKLPKIEELQNPPTTYTKQWYHTGKAPQKKLRSTDQKTFYKTDVDAYHLSETVLAAMSTAADENTLRQAQVALRGKLLRQEIYGLDDSEQQSHPFKIIENNYLVRCVKPASLHRYAIFSVHNRETLTYDYERQPNDPRIVHQFFLAWDEYGNLLKNATVYYPRRKQKIESSKPYNEQFCQKMQKEQFAITVLAVRARYINKAPTVLQERAYQFSGHLAESKQFEILIPDSVAKTIGYSFEELEHLFQQSESDRELRNEQLLQWKKYYYWDSQRQTALLNEIPAEEQPLLLHHTETVVDSQRCFETLYKDQCSEDLPGLLQNKAGYSLKEDYWWQSSLIHYYGNARGFYLPIATTSFGVDEAHPLWHKAEIQYDLYQLSPMKIINYLYHPEKKSAVAITHMEVQEFDYHHLLPRKQIDANQNTLDILYDALGVPVAYSHYGEVGDQVVGDYPLTETLLIQLEQATFEDLVQNPARYLGQAGKIICYDLNAWQKKENKQNTLQPNWKIEIATDHYQRPLKPLDRDTVNNVQYHQVISYQSGLGHIIQQKNKVEPGMGFNLTEQNERQEKELTSRWWVSGYTVFNNKGLVAQQYLPYYTASPDYENQICVISQLPPPTRPQYDALDRVIRTDLPKGFYRKATFTAWYECHYDENDTFKESPYYQKLSPEEKTALAPIEASADTPSISLLNSQGYPFLTVEMKKSAPEESATLLETRAVLNNQGKPLALQDPRLKKPNITFQYDKLGRVVCEDSVDQGKRLNLYNSADLLIQHWSGPHCEDRIDPEQHIIPSTDYYHFVVDYDNWQRSIRKWIEGGEGKDKLEEIYCYEQIRYGELNEQAAKHNLHGQIVALCDQSGVVYREHFDIQGKPLTEKVRYLLRQGKTEELLKPLNWAQQKENASASETFLYYYRYDALGNCVEQQQPNGSIDRRSYNSRQQLQRFSVLPNGKTAAIPIIQTIHYHASGQEQYVVYGNAMQTHYQYEASTQELTLLETTAPGSAQKKLQSIGYQHDPVGNIVAVDDQSYQALYDNPAELPTAQVQHYHYNSLYQLQEATGKTWETTKDKTEGKIETEGEKENLDEVEKLKEVKADSAPAQNTQTKATPVRLLGLFKEKEKAAAPSFTEYKEDYRYDAGNNLIEKHHQEIKKESQEVSIKKDGAKVYEIEEDANRLKGIPYDQSGNPETLDEQTHLRWNYLNQLIYVHKKTEQETIEEFYFYNAPGRRTRKLTRIMTSEGVSIHEKLYANHYTIQRQLQPNDLTVKSTTEVKTLRLHDESKFIALYQEFPAQQEGHLIYQLSNHLHSVTHEVDDKGELLSYEEYSPYGETLFIVGKDAQSVENKMYHYSGKEKDATTGLYYYGARYYADQQGRWLSPDPAGLIDGLNVYGFVGGNPVTFGDLGGMMKRGNASVGEEEEEESEEPEKEEEKEGPPSKRLRVQQNVEYSIYSIGTRHTWQHVVSKVRKGKAVRVALEIEPEKFLYFVEQRASYLKRAANVYVSVQYTISIGEQNTDTTIGNSYYHTMFPTKTNIHAACRIITGTFSDKPIAPHINERSTQPSAANITKFRQALFFGVVTSVSERIRGDYAPFVTLAVLRASKKQYNVLKGDRQKYINATLSGLGGGSTAISHFSDLFAKWRAATTKEEKGKWVEKLWNNEVFGVEFQHCLTTIGLYLNHSHRLAKLGRKNRADNYSGANQETFTPKQLIKDFNQFVTHLEGNPHLAPVFPSSGGGSSSSSVSARGRSSVSRPRSLFSRASSPSSSSSGSSAGFHFSPPGAAPALPPSSRTDSSPAGTSRCCVS